MLLALCAVSDYHPVNRVKRLADPLASFRPLLDVSLPALSILLLVLHNFQLSTSYVLRSAVRPPAHHQSGTSFFDMDDRLTV